MHENFTNDALDIKQECNDEEILDTIDNLKQEQITEETDTFVHHGTHSCIQTHSR